MPNGVVTYTAWIRDGFRKLDVTAHVLACELVGESEPDVLPVFVPGFRARVRRSAHWRARQVLRRPQIGSIEEGVIARTRALRRSGNLQVVEMEETHGWPAAVARRSVVPLVTRLHGPCFLTGPAGGIVEDERFRERVRSEGVGIGLAAAVSSPSRDVLERTRDRYGLSLENADVIPPPMPAAQPEHVWSHESCEQKTILFAGRFDRGKGADVVIDAFRILGSRDPALRLVLVGPDRGFVDDAGRRWNASEYVARVPSAIRERIKLTGEQPPRRLRELRLRGAAIVVPTRYETQGYTALEALAQGCPVVASRVGGLPEAIEHERNGLLFTSGKAEDLAEQVGRVLNDPALARRLGAQARRDVTDGHDPVQIARRTLELYRRVL